MHQQTITSNKQLSFQDALPIYIVLLGSISLIAGLSLKYSADVDKLANILQLIGIQKAGCSLDGLPFSYKIINSTIRNGIVLPAINFNSSITTSTSAARSSSISYNYKNITITIPGYLDYRLNSEADLITKFGTPELLIDIYTGLYNQTFFYCLAKSDGHVYGLYGSSRLQTALILGVIGLIALILICILFIAIYYVLRLLGTWKNCFALNNNKSN